MINVGVDEGHMNLHATPSELSNFTSLLNDAGAAVLVSTGPLNQSYLNSINLLLISSPQTSYTPAELSLLQGWYAGGGRLWLSASFEDAGATSNLNSMLRSLGSELGFEYGYASDLLFNLNSAPNANSSIIMPAINHPSGLIKGLTNNIRTLYGYRPVPVIGYDGSRYVEYNSTLEAQTTWIAKTASTATVSNSSSTAMLALSNGERGRMPIVVTEQSGLSRLVLTGYPVFSIWRETFAYRQDRPYDNRLLVGNLLHWMTNISINSELEASLPEIAGTTQPQVLIDTAEENQHSSRAELQPLHDLLTDMGFNVTTLPAYSFHRLQSAAALIIQSPTAGFTFPNDTDLAIKPWLQEGNKLLLVSSMGDYSLLGSSTESVNLNRLLGSIQASLRFELGSVGDPELNLGGNTYMPLSSIINHNSSSVANLTMNVRSLFTQFSTILAANGTGAFGGPDVALESNLQAFPRVTWIARTGNASYVFNHMPQPSGQLQVHTQGQRGSYITAALEQLDPNNRLVLVGGPIFSGFGQLLQYPTAYGYPVDNLLFIRNLFSPLLGKSQVKTGVAVTPNPSELQEGQNVTLNIEYYSLELSASNLIKFNRIPVIPANLSITLSGTTLSTTLLPNGNHTATGTPSGTGHVTWSATASATGHQSQSTSGTVLVNAPPERFTFYVLGIPVAVFIVVTIVAVARKTR